MDKKKVALIVDDLPEAREQIRLDVEALGHDATDASTFEEAREWLNTNCPDYVVLDLQIPMRQNTTAEIKYGMTLLDEIVAKHPCAAIVVVTAHGKNFRYSTEVMHKSRFVTFVPKPFVEDDPDNPSLMNGIKIVLAKVAEAHSGNGAAAPKNETPLQDIPRGTIDLRVLKKPRNTQVTCVVNGTKRAFSKEQHRILKLFADAQARRNDDTERYNAAVEASAFGFNDAKNPNARNSAFTRLRTRLQKYLPEGHPPVCDTPTYQEYCLGCFCIDSTPKK
jgi:CheY-like chemotaxis protein